MYNELLGFECATAALRNRDGVGYSVSALNMSEAAQIVRDQQAMAVGRLSLMNMSSSIVFMDDATIVQSTTRFRDEAHLDVPGADLVGERMAHAMVRLLNGVHREGARSACSS